MAEPVDYIERTREQYAGLGYPAYRWVENPDPPPFTPLSKPLTECRVGLIASGGIYRTGQPGFHFADDTSYRAIPTDTDESELRAIHFAYDLTDVRQDPNVVFPMTTLKDLANTHRIRELTGNAYTFMGGIYSARRVKGALAPALAEQFIRDEVDVAILVPA